MRLSWRCAPEATLENLANLEHDFDIYTAWGFRDSVNVNTKVVSDSYLALDQGMIMAAIGNALAQDMLREAFVTPAFRRALRDVGFLLASGGANVSRGRRASAAEAPTQPGAEA